jgi:AMMECR1 domain-containing protein
VRNFGKNDGVFVTLSSLKKAEKQLRGCIGYPYPTIRLLMAVIDSALNAATQDPRFEPLL